MGEVISNLKRSVLGSEGNELAEKIGHAIDHKVIKYKLVYNMLND